MINYQTYFILKHLNEAEQNFEKNYKFFKY
jgi:hypothetical protein